MIWESIFNIFLFCENSIHNTTLNVSSCQINNIISFIYVPPFEWYESYLWLHNRCISYRLLTCLPACLYLCTSLDGSLCLWKLLPKNHCHAAGFFRIWNKTNIITLFYFVVDVMCVRVCFFFVLFASTANIFSIICIIVYIVEIAVVYSLSSMRTGADKFLELLNRSIFYISMCFPSHSLPIPFGCSSYHIPYSISLSLSHISIVLLLLLLHFFPLWMCRDIGLHIAYNKGGSL